MTANQHPIGSGFTSSSTADDVLAGIDLRGRNVLVTGGSGQLGREVGRALAAAGANVTSASRRSGLDLLDPASIGDFAARWLETGRPLHMLINNAGIANRERILDTRGYEAMFATNHLGHFQLTRALRPALAAAGGARVVNVSSGAHRVSGIRWDDLSFATGFDATLAYGQSKTANILHAVELDRRWSGDGIRGFALHPGIVTDRRPSEPVDETDGPIVPVAERKTPGQAAATVVFGAASPLLAGLGGVYLKDSDVAVVDPTPWPATTAGRPVITTDAAPHALDPASADRLWSLSENLLTLGALPSGR